MSPSHSCLVKLAIAYTIRDLIRLQGPLDGLNLWLVMMGVCVDLVLSLTVSSNQGTAGYMDDRFVHHLHTIKRGWMDERV